MIGLFQELGPCRIRNDSSGVDLNDVRPRFLLAKSLLIGPSSTLGTQTRMFSSLISQCVLAFSH